MTRVGARRPKGPPGSACQPPHHRERVFAGVDAAELPRVAAVAARRPEPTAEDTYLDGLRALVNGLVEAG
ncbi:hypothetical protein [Actinomadura sp. WMMB 499]|uniref:hypothetical protein n=1 Tax=Actinomadura sp. WMMB 499 TaxID=1219491 RepID=UPI001247265D|nr:hypothetical protein [Actinomadura sp. WMMB 499]QFG20561.1 hypothetical protein F7P10_04745 [Actinomadura sp. WMMB 499]